MNLELEKIIEKLEQNDFINNFMKELNQAIENFSKKNDTDIENMEDIILNEEQELQYEKEEFDFLQKYFEKELSDTTNGEIFIVTNKYENDPELNRYKVTQYKNNFECKYIALKQDLPENVQIGDVVRKKDGKYFYDEEATRYIKENKERIKRTILG